jgi:RNA polymerase sigma-70 factor (ECF subfamily)
MNYVVSAGDLVLTIPRERRAAVGFDDLVAAHRQRVVRTAYRILGNLDDAQDVAQEVFVRLLANLDKIDGDAQAWLYRVTVNACHDHFRRQRPMVDLVIERPDGAPSAEQALLVDERKRLLMEGLKVLTRGERGAVVLRDIEGLGTRETAEILGVEEVTVRSQISSARVKLAKYVRSRK